MTDMRERVARAICESEMGLEMLDAMPNTAPRYYSAADAALIACGYAEMRKALENLIENVTFYERVGISDEKDFKADRANAIAVARSILERTGEK